MARQPLSSPAPRAVAVVVRGAKLLVIDRHIDGRDYAVLPGGGVEPGETPAQAAVRELAEECSLDGTVVRHLFDGDRGGRQASYFLVDAPDGEPVLGGSEVESQSDDNRFHPLWATARELPLLGLLPEGICELVAREVWPVRLEPVGADEWPVLGRLWQLYQHDLSEFRHSAPQPDAGYLATRLERYREDADHEALLAWQGDVPYGFALARELGDGRSHVLGEFFVTRSVRGSGLARGLASAVLARHPGRWVIAFQEENPRAAAFWRGLATELFDDIAEEAIAVPGKRHLPSDIWLSGTTR